MKTVRDIFRVDRVKGEVGIEIEVEGQNLPVPKKYWRRDTDPSLKGEFSAIEYVLNKPVQRNNVGKVLDYLEECYITCNTEVIDSVRCGVHVHINVQELNIVQLYNFMLVYLILEDLLVKYCGEYREGNLFCLRAKDAEYLVYALKRAVHSREFRSLRTDKLRYASMNVKALGTYGSLEFRAMRGTRDMSAIKFWVDTLLRIKDAALEFDNPQDILADFSGDVCDVFLERVLKEDCHQYKYPDYQTTLLQGVRGVQGLVYTVDWDRLKEWSEGKLKREPTKMKIDWIDGAPMAAEFAAPPPEPQRVPRRPRRVVPQPVHRVVDDEEFDRMVERGREMREE